MPRTLEEIFDELREVLKQNTEVRVESPGRVISRSAKSVMPGMMVEFPVNGWALCTGVTHYTKDGHTLLSGVGSTFWSTKSSRRVRTRIVE